MKCEASIFVWVFLTLVVLAVSSLAQSPQALASCESAPEVRKVLDENLNGKELEKMAFRERAARRRALYEELIAKYPREVEPYQRLIEDTRRMYRELDPSQYPALQDRFRKQVAQDPNDPLALYVAGVALFMTDTPESLSLLEAAKIRAPQFPWPSLKLAEYYSTGQRMDKERSSANLAVFFARCPDSTDELAQELLAKDKDAGLRLKVATALRARLAKESDRERLEDYGALWALEFRTHPPQEHDALRKEVAEDVERLASLNPKPDSEWQAFLINGSKQAGASSETITGMENRLLRAYPHSDEAYGIVSERWRKANKKPDDPRDLGAWAKYHAAFREALKAWIHDFPDNSRIGHRDWLYSTADEDSLTEKDGIAAIDQYLRYNAVHSPPGASIQLESAEFLLKHKWQPDRALDLLEQAKATLGREHERQRANDDLSAEERDDLNERLLAEDMRVAGAILKAARLAGRPDAAVLVKRLVEEPPPTQEKLLSGYWWNRARLATLESRKHDALVYYQLSLNTRLEPPKYSEGKIRDDLTDEAQTLWKETGGTPVAWPLQSKAFHSKAEEPIQGGWERPTKTLPAFELSDLSGKTWRLKDLEGKAVLINVWATWCGPCNAELPKLQKLYEQLNGRSDIQLLTLDIDEDLGLVAPYLKDKGYTFPILPAYSLVNNLLNGDAPIPQNWIVGPKGKWLWIQFGYGEEDNWPQLMTEKLESAKTSD
jgi:thiol-disulfide isomerase/thioredoxin